MSSTKPHVTSHPFTIRSSSKQHKSNNAPINSRDEISDHSLPPLPSSSSPASYEIPSLRRKPVPNKNNTPVKHNRSLSHPFPSLFGSKKSEKKLHEDEFESSDGGSPTATDMPKSRMLSSGPKPITKIDREPVTGKCMTCDCTVRWPQDLKAFRCTTCLTVNDLEPHEETNTWQLGERHKMTAPKAMPISLSKTRALIDRCLNDYLSRQMETNSAQLVANNSKSYTIGALPARTEPTFDHGISHRSAVTADSVGENMQHDEAFAGRQLSDSTSKPFLSADDTQAGHVRQRSTNDSDAAPSTKDPSLSIFRPVESYVAACYNGCAPMNMSFFSIKPAGHATDRARQETKLSYTIINPAPALQTQQDPPMSELDAKTLLLGDVVGNGSWWAGRSTHKDSSPGVSRGKSPERWHGIVNARSPRIHWTELAEWYRLLIQAGDDWQNRWFDLRPPEHDPQRSKWEAVSQQRLHYHLRESQLHLQRALLKATENLLKRPKRPLNNPEDCRFLLMLMMNPMLSSTSQRGTLLNPDCMPRHVREPSSTQKPHGSSPSKRQPSITSRSSNSGQHSGLLKRIFGLLSNLKNDLHQHLVWWISRFSDSHFQKLVDMVSSFITYRLSKQQDRTVSAPINPTEGLVPSFSDGGLAHASQLHDALELRPSKSSKQKNDGKAKLGVYSEDWQVRAAARFMALLFQANTGHSARRRDISITHEQRQRSTGLNAKYQANSHGQIIPISHFYSTMLDHLDLIADFEAWESTKTKFTFCQYPFFLSIWAKIHILEYDARRQMESRAREAFFDSILSRKAVSQYLVLKVRRDCLVEDSLRGVSETVGSGSSDIKKGLRIDFVGEEGIDAGGLRKEWFLLLVREIFDPHHGLFVYDDDSQYCYFNPNCFESSEQFFLVGILLGLAIYNSTILDVALPPFLFKKMLASAPQTTDKLTSMPRVTPNYTLDDLAEFRPALARGLRQLLDFDGDVQSTFCRDFVVEADRYGELVQVPLCSNGHKRAVTNSNRKEFVDLYVRYLLDTAVARQYEPFKRGFFTVCGGNALSLFRPQEIDLLVRGSDEPLDINSMRAVATYDNWPKQAGPAEKQPQVIWFWESFERATPADQRKLLGFITGSDRIPAMGATNLTIRIQMIQDKEAEDERREPERFPVARTCFNTISLYQYWHRETLDSKLWMAVTESEGFGLK